MRRGVWLRAGNLRSRVAGSGTAGVLAERPINLARHFFIRAAKVVEIPWTLAASNDLRVPEVRGRRSLGSSLILWLPVIRARMGCAPYTHPSMFCPKHSR